MPETPSVRPSCNITTKEGIVLFDIMRVIFSLFHSALLLSLVLKRNLPVIKSFARIWCLLFSYLLRLFIGFIFEKIRKEI